MASVQNVIGKNGPLESRFVASIEGGPELARKLQELVDIAQTDAAKDAVGAGLDVIGDEMRALAPVGPEPIHIRDAIGKKVGKTKRGAGGTVGVRILPGVDDDKQPVAYGPRLEFGGFDRSPEPFIRPSFDAKKEAAVDAVGERLAAAVEEVAR